MLLLCPCDCGCHSCHPVVTLTLAGLAASLGYCNCSQNTRGSQHFHSGLKDWRRHKACQSRLHDNSDIYYKSLILCLFERAVFTNFANFFIETSIKNPEAIFLLGLSLNTNRCKMRGGGFGVHIETSKMSRRSSMDIWPSSAVINAASCSWEQLLKLLCLSVTARAVPNHNVNFAVQHPQLRGKIS